MSLSRQFPEITGAKIYHNFPNNDRVAPPDSQPNLALSLLLCAYQYGGMMQKD